MNKREASTESDLAEFAKPKKIRIKPDKWKEVKANIMKDPQALDYLTHIITERIPKGTSSTPFELPNEWSTTYKDRITEILNSIGFESLHTNSYRFKAPAKKSLLEPLQEILQVKQHNQEDLHFPHSSPFKITAIQFGATFIVDMSDETTITATIDYQRRLMHVDLEYEGQQRVVIPFDCIKVISFRVR
jgi:hypothetical protein